MPNNPGLLWVLRLRWVALLAQGVTIAVAALALRVPLHVPLLLTCLGVTAGTNLAAQFWHRHLQPRALGWCGALLVLDTVTLTALLHGSGRTSNPFTSFLLLHVTLAALLLPPHLTLLIIGLVTSGFTSLYLVAPDPAFVVPGIFQVQGQFLALSLTTICIAYFVGRTQDALRESQLRLVREERFASLATLAAGVAHELATPLGTIAVVSRELEHTACNQCLSHTCRDDARLIRAEIDRCRTIIDRLNADSTAGIGDVPVALPLAQLSAELRPFLSSAHAARLHVALSPSTGDVLHLPKSALLQSLAVLVKNACEADTSGHPVLLRVESAGGHLAFVVEDRGPGITAAVSSRLGEPFFTTKPVGQGMGLGLYIARMFAERLRGRLELRPGSGGGTTARLTLPHPSQKVLHP